MDPCGSGESTKSHSGPFEGRRCIGTFYGHPGQRRVGYDNERAKGDHGHIRDREVPYPFTTPEKLIDDFLGDIEKLRSE